MFSLGGRLQREAYSKIIEKRFGASIDTGLRRQSGRIAAMVDGAPNSTEQYEQLFSNYVKEVAGQVPNRYLGLTTDKGREILETMLKGSKLNIFIQFISWTFVFGIALFISYKLNLIQ